MLNKQSTGLSHHTRYSKKLNFRKFSKKILETLLNWSMNHLHFILSTIIQFHVFSMQQILWLPESNRNWKFKYLTSMYNFILLRYTKFSNLKPNPSMQVVYVKLTRSGKSLSNLSPLSSRYWLFCRKTLKIQGKGKMQIFNLIRLIEFPVLSFICLFIIVKVPSSIFLIVLIIVVPICTYFLASSYYICLDKY